MEEQKISFSILHNNLCKYRNEKRKTKRYYVLDEVNVLKCNDNSDNCYCKGIDISISGVGFFSQKLYKEDDYLDVVLRLDNKCTIPVLIKVVRFSIFDNGYIIGAEFIGMLSVYTALLSKTFEKY